MAPVYDVPPGVAKLPTWPVPFVFTGQRENRLLQAGKYEEKVYWYLFCELIDEEGHLIDAPDPSVDTIRVRWYADFTNGVKKFPNSHEAFRLGLNATYVSKDGERLETVRFFHVSAETTHREGPVVVAKPASWWSQISTIHIDPYMLLDGESFEGSGIPTIDVTIDIPIIGNAKKQEP
ncbi:hypothetical protein D2N39_13120 [Gemmobacter lutimaris]|uniref:Uncharacterized protein n=1 Tax=Gemmobacter lutimaris TaxID=2306023 RepID=A0A398BVF3_9RHOB|nr:hypothetical protein [Gemmobacter lutimaris]RID91196.1 hypothetical protein D2N39_13120 [Gemmobacter lutimaris]